jgi:hypothetical protein
MGATAGLVAAMLYLVGPFLHWNTNCCLIFSQFATWIPLALLGIELALTAPTWRDRVVPWFLAGFAVSQMFAGWIGEGWLYAVLLPAGYAAYRLLFPPLRSPAPLPARLRAGAATAAATVGLGLALAAAGMLPRFAINAETNLAGGDYSRLPGGGVLNPPWTLDYLLLQTFGAGSGYHFRAASFGGAAVVLALLALPLAGRRFAAPFFAALTLTAMLLTLDWTPLHLPFSLIPRWQEFHEHDAWRTIALAAIGPAMLGGAAIEALPRWRGRPRMLPLVVAPLALMAVMTLAIGRPETPVGWQPLLAAALTTGLVALVVAVPTVRRGPVLDRVRRLVPALVLAVAVLIPTGLELTGSWLGWPPNAIREPEWLPDPALEAALATEVGRTDAGGAGAFLQERLAADGPFRYAGYAGYGYAADLGLGGSYMGRWLDPGVQAILTNGRPIFLGLYDIQGYNPLHLERYDEFVDALNGVVQDYHTAFLMPSAAGSPLLDLLAVRYLVVDAALPPEREDVVALTAGHHEVFRTPRVVVYERAPPPPHAWIVHDVRTGGARRGAAVADRRHRRPVPDRARRGDAAGDRDAGGLRDRIGPDRGVRARPGHDRHGGRCAGAPRRQRDLRVGVAGVRRRRGGGGVADRPRAARGPAAGRGAHRRAPLRALVTPPRAGHQRRRRSSHGGRLRGRRLAAHQGNRSRTGGDGRGGGAGRAGSDLSAQSGGQRLLRGLAGGPRPAGLAASGRLGVIERGDQHDAAEDVADQHG